MPRVSEAYLEARREQILQASWACFHRAGYHRTTIQDIADEAGMSPGAVYRYFDSKEDIFAGTAQMHLSRARSNLEAAGMDDDLWRIFSEHIRTQFARKAPDDCQFGQLLVEVWGEALRNPRVLEICRANFESVRTSLAVLVKLHQQHGRIESDLDPFSVARVMMSLFQGAVVQSTIDDSLDIDAYLEVVQRITFRPADPAVREAKA